MRLNEVLTVFFVIDLKTDTEHIQNKRLTNQKVSIAHYTQRNATSYARASCIIRIKNREK
jgi:hypothetical protein